MSAKILDGQAVSRQMRAELKDRVAQLKKRGVVPGLGVLLVGDHPASRSYVAAKEKACTEIGIYSAETNLPRQTKQADILEAVRTFNEDERIDGILVQLPLPDSAMEQAVLTAVHPEKDVDGFHPLNIGKMVLGLPAFLPCTPHGILQLLDRSGIAVAGQHVVVIGRSNIVGRPLTILLAQKSRLGNATVTQCHTGTRDLAGHTRRADIVVVAAGQPRTLTADMIRAGAVVIDVGVNRVEDPGRAQGYRLVGDVEYESVKEKASAITPVPGGVGPMTITMLLHNTVESARRRADAHA